LQVGSFSSDKYVEPSNVGAEAADLRVDGAKKSNFIVPDQ
jgi:hypothetical protein